MKLPDVKGQNKIRDSYICTLYVRDGLSQAKIATMVGLSPSRIQAIVYANRDVLKIDSNYEKIQRINKLKSLLVKHPDTMGKKSTLDILSELRKELEGDEKLNVNQAVYMQMPVIKLNGKPLEFNIGKPIPRIT